MFDAELHAQIAVRLIRDLDQDMRKAIAKDSKGIGDDLVAAIRAHPGVSPYGQVYRELGRAARVRTRPGLPPEVVVGGSRRFSGGATVNQLARPYEFGARTGDLKRGSARGDAARRGRRRGRRPLRQFPPASNDGLWVNAVCEVWDRGPLLQKWLEIVDDVLGGVASKDHG